MAARDYDYEHRRARLLQLEAMPWCEDCGEPATVADHNPPLSRHDHVPGSGCCEYRSHCQRCSRRQGGELGSATTNSKPAPSVPEWVEPESIPVTDPRWDVPWLADLLDVPDDATWPRFATVPHPDAVGSYGLEVERRALDDHGVELRWWQRLVLRLLLQHDADGQLLWAWAIFTTARQSGKTWLLRELAWWRLHTDDLFDDRQQIVHTARTLAPAWDTILPVLYEVLDHDDYEVTRAQARYGVFRGIHGWRIMSQSNVYGQTASLGLVDEGWGVKPSDITDGFEPTIVERESGQLLLVSTAHRRATALMPARRMEALDKLEAPARGLIVEWSAPPDAELDDRAAWRQASPSWSTRREALMAESLERARSGISLDPDEPDPIESFRAQWLNQWRVRTVAKPKGDALVTDDAWAALGVEVPNVPSGAAVMAIEDWHGNGYGAVLVGEIDGGLLARAWTFTRRNELLTWLANVVALPTVIAGVSLAHDPALVKVAPSVIAHGTSETSVALPLLRDMIASERIRHVGSPALTDQITAVEVAPTASGLKVASRGRDDLVRCLAWAVRHIDQGLAEPGGVY